ncbi:hypothetical protein B566_EDAN006749 [Ephemera danica]|nr:hypothetical protein B566_EDAN006749 [Ephemera danica]
MRGSAWIILQLTGVVVAVLSVPTSETRERRVQPDGTELSGSASSHLALQTSGPGVPPVKEPGDLQGAGGVAHGVMPLLYAIPQLSLLLQLLQLVLDVLYKSPQFAQFAHFAAAHPPPHHPPGALLHPKVGPAHGIPHPGLYGNGLYGVSANSPVGKGRPFGPYKYEDNQ